MGTKLIKLRVPQALHTRITTVAASKDQKIVRFLNDFLEEHIPREIRFLGPSQNTVESKEDENRQEPIRRGSRPDVEKASTKNIRDKSRKGKA